MANDTIDILIRFGLSKEKATEAVQEMNKLKAAGKEATTELAAGTEKADGKTRELKKSLQLVGHEFGALGRLAHFALDPIIAGAAAAAFIIGQLKDEWGSWLAAVQNGAVNAARGIGDIKQSLEELETARIKADQAYKTSLEDLNRETTRKITALKEEQQALEELTLAREKAETAGAKTDEERSEISKRYTSFRRGLSEETLAKEIRIREGAMQAEAQGLAARGHDAAKDSHGLSPDQVNAKLQDLPKILKSLDEQIAEQQKITKDLEPGFWMTLGHMMHGKEGAANLRTAYAAVDSSKQTEDKLKATSGFYAGLEQPLLRAQTADNAVFSGLRRLDIEGEALGDLRNTAGRRHRTNLQLGGIEAGHDGDASLLMTAADGADAIRGGGRATQDQSKAINEAAKALGLQGQSTQLILSVMSQFNNNQKALFAGLKAIEAQVKSNNQRP